jgi:hypothetical protein
LWWNGLFRNSFNPGVNGYFRKPSEFSEFLKLGPLVRDLLARNETPPV